MHVVIPSEESSRDMAITLLIWLWFRHHSYFHMYVHELDLRLVALLEGNGFPQANTRLVASCQLFRASYDQEKKTSILKHHSSPTTRSLLAHPLRNPASNLTRNRTTPFDTHTHTRINRPQCQTSQPTRGPKTDQGLGGNNEDKQRR